MIEWYEMVNGDESKKDAVSKALLQYCGLDTMAMVKVWEKLKKLVE
jgi:predicted Zn-dependent protease